MKETDRLFACEYCKGASYLLPKHFFRFMLPQNAPAGKELIYFPYWRFKGMMFSCVCDGIEHRFVDVSHQAVDSINFPASLGLRSQTLKLQFVNPETKGRFLKPNLPFEDVMRIIEKRFNTFRQAPVFHQSYIGETLSLIYSPFYLGDTITDAVLNRPVNSKPAADLKDVLSGGERPGRSVQFLPALCPACGWDLRGEPDALVLDCRNCDSLWEPTRKGFKRLKFAYIPEKGDRLFYLPFWRIKAKISGITLDSYADLVKIANLPKVVQRGWEDVAFHFWVLAFKLPPQNFLNLSRNLTLTQPSRGLARGLPDADCHPVKLPVEEALECLKIILASFIKPPERHLPRLGEITIKPKSYLLVYIPFFKKNRELIQPILHMTINRNLLDLTGG